MVAPLIDSNLGKALAEHVLCKKENHQWLTHVLDGNLDAFPYVPVEEGSARVDTTDYIPCDPCKVFPYLDQSHDTIYHVTIPMAHIPGIKNDDQLFSLLKLFQEQAFGTNACESAVQIRRRFSLVIGINQIKSLDTALNGSFISFIEKLQKIDTFANRVFGFFWNVQWRCSSYPKIYPVQTAYTLVKVFNSELAKKVQISLEMPNGALNGAILSQIPFQRIRERIKNCVASTTLMDHILNNSDAEAPIYFGVMDADCQKMRTDLGLFSRIDNLICSRTPSAISLGYSLADDELPLIRLGVKLDMAVREAMNSVVPYSAYFPEPCSLFRLRAPHKKNCPLLSLSFMGDGRVLENRRLIQNAIKNELLDDSAVFIADGGVTMRTPGRMKTLKNEKVEILTVAIVKQRASLKALKHVSQSHAFPKQWAEGLYFGLGLQGFKSSVVTDATKKFMDLLAVYDPVSRMKSEPGRHSPKKFDKIMQDYSHPLSDGRLNTRNTTIAQLYKMKMSKALIQMVDDAAKKSGEAIFHVLRDATHS